MDASFAGSVRVMGRLRFRADSAFSSDLELLNRSISIKSTCAQTFDDVDKMMGFMVDIGF
jgi:hypothetical protein